MSMRLSDILPAPSAVTDEYSSIRRDPWFQGRDAGLSKAVVSKEPPPYMKRNNWKPSNPEDFGDGGAFPEIHMAQFPLGMGMGESSKNASTLALQYDSEGKLRHDAIARLGRGKDQVVYSKLADTKAKVWNEEDEDVQKPDEDSIAAITEKTRQALEKITQSKVDSALPVRHAEKTAPAQYIRYTPSQQADGAAPQQRIIRMVEEQKDPMEPPKFKINQKIPRAPPSPPAPVMHSPPRKVTAKDQEDWKIPPCISNWKNPKGFTVALDKRLAADGRGLQQTHINENFAKLSEALYKADRVARDAVERRAEMERKVAQNKKTEQEERMREVAKKAREDRKAMNVKREDDNDDAAKARREIRKDRLDDVRKERNIARNRPDKLDKMRRDRERDISEKIVLGLPDSNARSGEVQFDQRLFDQSKGLDSGGIDDETYSAYDAPWRADNVQQHLYRPSKNIDKDVYGEDLDKIINTNRFVPDKGFSGTEGGAQQPRSGPVQFERDQDVFGLGELFQQVNKKRMGDSSKDDRGGEEKRRRRDEFAKMAARKKGLSLDEKRSKMLELFYESKEFFQMKELEKIAPKQKGVIAQSVKDVVQSLVDDGLVECEKIGTFVCYWAFPSRALQLRKRKLEDLERQIEELRRKIATTKEEIKQSSVGREVGKLVQIR
ncbi:hypothetical protein WR25_24176 isoform B [Diploscapter pachys]|uniref:SKI-interacting protein SKIP SNW domain-containing protein n=1 Tax=Diploscapter pachys TaxID=2018661 RepID=A0A2A2KZ41_9BILA|nr:hypothetical protein WR25_24176 isoform B [Diploscapter pachys]